MRHLNNGTDHRHSKSCCDQSSPARRTMTLGHNELIAPWLLLPFPWCSHHGTYVPLRGINTLRPRHNGRHFTDDIFKCIFLNENVLIPIKISLKFVPKGPINYISALVQIMAWRRPGDKPLSEPMMVKLLTHVCVTRPQWVKITHTYDTLYRHDTRWCDAKSKYGLYFVFGLKRVKYNTPSVNDAIIMVTLRRVE